MYSIYYRNLRALLLGAALTHAAVATADDAPLKGVGSAAIDPAQLRGELVDARAFLDAYQREVLAFSVKDEYESTADFKARMQSGPTLKRLSWDLYYRFMMDDTEITYDADQGVFLVGREKTYSRLGEDRVSYDVLDKSVKYQWLHLARATTASTYSGQNAFGVGAKVTKVSGQDLYARVTTKSLTNPVQQYGYNAQRNVLHRKSEVFLLANKEHLSAAKTCTKEVIVTARLSKDIKDLKADYSPLLDVTSSPKIDSPFDVDIKSIRAAMTLARMDMLCAGASIPIASFDYSAPSPRTVIVPN